MKTFIKHLLRENIGILSETMISTNNTEFHENGDTNYIAIAQDDNTKDFFVLWVELHKDDNEYIYSYFFNVMNQSNDKIPPRLYTRNEVAKYLPSDIKQTIIPLVREMTVNLVNRVKPNIITRNTVEFLTQKSMKRYDEISQLLQNELGYDLIWQGKNDEGKQAWKFQKKGNEHELNEDNINHFYSVESSRVKKILEEANISLFERIKKHGINLRKENI